MKNLWIISVAILAGVTLAGCNPNSTGWTKWYIESQKETTGSDVVLTEYGRDGDGFLREETRTLNDALVYKDSRFEYDTNNKTVTRYRDVYGAGGTYTSQKIVAYYTTSNFGVVCKYEAFDLGTAGNEEVPVEFWEETYDTNGNPTHFIKKVSGQTVEERTDYYSVGNVKGYTMKAGGVDTVMRYLTVSDGIELYAGWESEINKGTLVEKTNNYIIHSQAPGYSAYTITKYDANGQNPVPTRVNITWGSESID